MKLNFSKNKSAQFFALFVSVLFLFLISCANFHFKEQKRINSVQNIDIINEKQASPRQLFLDSWNIIKNNYYLNNLNKQNWSRWKKRYLNVIETPEDAALAINSMIASLDDNYSKFLNEEEFLLLNDAINSKLYGIGINIASVSGKIKVVNVLENAPAYNCGILPGDIILKINKIDIKGKSIYETAGLIKGNKNEFLELEILRGTEKFSKIVKRDEIKVKTIDYKKIDENIGYIRISSFIGIDTPKEFIIALNRLKDTKGLILDLRGNSGGLFQNAIVIANLFIDKGTIVNVIARHGKKNVYNAQNDGCIYNNPLVVLVDNNSASASEILSSALKENHRAILIGTKTYGKGLVQKIFPLSNKTGMNLTIARYLTPNGSDINKKGVEPDYTINFSHSDFVNNIDPQLNYAQKYLSKEIENKFGK